MPRKKGHPKKFVPAPAPTTTATSAITATSAVIAHTAIAPNDFVTNLPRELKISILSFLPTEIAAQTSLLSHWWNDLWKNVQIINFNYENNPSLTSFVICRAISLHIAPTCQEVRIRVSNADEQVNYHVASWFWFAAKKSVQRLELYLPITHFPVRRDARLDFPELSFNRTTFLKYLCLHSKSVSSENIEYILKQCPNLEELSLYGSYRVLKLTISSESLKRLEILSCYLLFELKLNAKNLVSFKYGGPDLKISFDNVPLLGEVSFVDTYCRFLAKRQFRQFSPVLEQLETVKMAMSYPWFDCFTPVNKLGRLKNLELNIKVWVYKKAFNLISSLVWSLPGLQKLKLHLFWAENVECFGDLNFMSKRCKHFHLRDVELVGFIGVELDMEILEYLIKNAVNLESLKVRVCKEVCMENPKNYIEEDEKEEAIEIAYDLGAMVKPRTKFVVVCV